jgi:hypothetical protein
VIQFIDGQVLAVFKDSATAKQATETIKSSMFTLQPRVPVQPFIPNGGSVSIASASARPCLEQPPIAFVAPSIQYHHQPQLAQSTAQPQAQAQAQAQAQQQQQQQQQQPPSSRSETTADTPSSPPATAAPLPTETATVVISTQS